MSGEIGFETRGSLGLVTFVRPKALNALSLSMIREMHPQLDRWEADPAITVIAVRGTGGKAFCAGGDVRAVWDAGRDGSFVPGKPGHLAGDFFREEYRLNHRIKTLSKPYVALIDGIVMGGGVGLSVHGMARVASERTLFAMPETHIGLFPDVGGSYFLPRLPDSFGLYLGLTGERLKAEDCLTAEIATHYLLSAQHEALLEALSKLAPGADAKAVTTLLDGMAAAPEADGHLAADRAAIERCFAGKQSLEAIAAALAGEEGDWAKLAAKRIASGSPTSLKVTFEQLRRGGQLDFDACMIMEYRMSQAFMDPRSDFYEGIRAVLVDKDRSPKWAPASLEAVTAEWVERHFVPLGDLDLTF
ncbi:MAG: enoyl-CoA hydratase/isomerase family protein [Rhodospirillales bacterium]|nr:enoyl-CoA hydratase/isomerase family protein [Rhodospirillales bacterium]